MKRFFLTIFSLATLAACNNDPKTPAASGSTDKPAEAEKTGPSANPDYAAGLELVSKSDCFTCHKVDERIVGPTYREVANKYAAEAPGIIPKLAQKIIQGGSGVWGQTPMLSHTSLSQEDAETMVKYILTLKN